MQIKTFGSAIVAILLTSVFAITAMAAAPLCQEIFTLSEGSQPRSDLQQNSFKTGRGLEEYSRFLPEIPGEGRLASFIKKYGPQNHIIDASAGQARAMRDYLRDNPQGAQVTAISFKKPDSDPTLNADLQRLSNRFQYLEWNWDQMSEQELGNISLPKADLVLDIVGYAQYTDHLPQSLEKLSMVTKTGGVIGVGILEMLVASVQRSRMYLEIVDQNNQSVSLEEYLRHVDGLEILAYEFSADSVNESGSTFFLRKSKEHVHAPPLKLISPPDSNSPPYRKYLWIR